MSGNQTRLDRLLLLLDTGSAAATRKAAAEQIGEVSEQSGLAGVQNLLGRVRLLLRSKSWETRVAAGHAMDAICRRMEVWAPETNSMDIDVKPTIKQEGGVTTGQAESQLLKKFDVQGVIQRGQVLVSSSGKEYDEIDMDPKERLAMQKQQLRETLGLGPAPPSKGEKKDPKGDIYNVQDMVQDEDLVASVPIKQEPEEQKKKRAASDLVDDLEANAAAAPAPGTKPSEADLDMLSPRERNKLRRKQRKIAQDKAAAPTSSRTTTSAAAQSKSVVTDQPKDDSKVVVESVTVETYTTEPNEWPLAPVCDDLRHDIFDSAWEIRHGAALGLREVLKYHAQAAGKWAGTSKAQQEEEGLLWLEECATRLLCAMALDRFGDYVSDQVVAPVRETCAQVLGVVLRHLPESYLGHVTSILTTMQAISDWEVRHGGMLGLKYLIAVREDSVTKGMLRDVLPVVRGGIEGEDDDVRAVAAEALGPLAAHMVADPDCSAWFTGRLLSLLWSTLLQLDDLTASTGTVMNLISELYQHMPKASTLVVQAMAPGEEWDGKGAALGFQALLPRLYPFFRHNIQAVRRSVLRICTNVLRFCEGRGDAGWLGAVLGDSLHLLFLNVILEQRSEVLEPSHALWEQLLAAAPGSELSGAVQPRLGSWFSAVGTPPGMPLDPSMLEGAGQVSSALAAAAREQIQKKRSKTMAKKGGASGVGAAEGGGEDQGGLTSIDDFSSSVAMRLSGVRALGALLQRYEAAGLEVGAFVAQLARLLGSKLGTQVQVAALVLGEWAWASAEKGGERGKFEIPSDLQKTLEEHLSRVGQSDHPYEEMEHLTVKWQAEVQGVIKLYADLKVKEAQALQAKGPEAVKAMSSLEGLQVAQQAGEWEAKLPEKAKAGEAAKLRQKESRKVFGTIGQLEEVQSSLHTSVTGAVGAAFVAAKVIPAKVGPLIRSVMDSVQKEQQEALQQRAAKAVVGLLRCCSERKNSPNGKVLNNLCAFLCEDNAFTPRPCDLPAAVEDISIENLTYQPPSDAAALASTDDAVRAARVKKRGAALALAAVARDYGAELFAKNPALWQRMHAPLQQNLGVDCALDDAAAQEAIDAMQVLSVLMPAVADAVHAEILAQLLPRVLAALPCKIAAVRQMAARSLARLACVATVPVMEKVIREVLPLLGDAEQPLSRLGATEALHRLVQEMHLQVLPFAIFLVVPILGRMSDNHRAVRQTITKCFGTLLQLLPLEAGIPDPEGLSPDLVQEKHKERRFLEQLLDTSKIDNFQIPVKVEAELRRYQQEGVNWMAFLLKYQLHGVLADDMGLGKTLQTICIISSDHHNRREEFKKSGLPAHAPLPSMVVCPPTLVGHWAHEVGKFVGTQLKTVQYVGNPAERAAMRSQVEGDCLVITSYDTLRNDVDFLGGFTYDYCVLDEGHVIKNAKSKTTMAIKTVKANHRLILSGTPIQNNALELWSLFDFLMPGFLGSDKYFNQVYSKPILQSRNAKCSSKEAEAGALALESLHRQVLPFMLRRTKAQVLSDLPPKIIQDYYCELSPLQQRLYNDFAAKQKANAAAEIGGPSSADKSGGLAGHIFQALQYLKKLANHPKLVLNDSHPEYSKVMKELADQGRTLRDVSLAPKLMALRQLLWDCGIGVEEDGKASGDGLAGGGGGSGAQHRVLIFAQMKVMLDIIEQDLFKQGMPTVTYLRMDGATPNARRFEMQQQFNGDPTIDVLLLTTHVGGLGLNLTGADTVIFVEHDWNPMRDLQAMDRAHRIGQKSVVNVYRLITKGTLEEKIMGLQRFKLSIANSVVNEDNASLKNMDTAQLLDLFSPTDAGGKEVKDEKADGGEEKAGTGKLAQVLQGLEELWDEEQYNEAFNVDSYLASLPSAKK